MEPSDSAPLVQRTIGRYVLHREIASGGMATVHLGRLLGEIGFSRTVAIKRMHEHCARDPEFVSMFVDEARVASRIRHPNVVPILDVVSRDGELFIVMEYVQGESFSRLLRASRELGSSVPLNIVSGVMVGVLEGLHAAHEALSEQGLPLGIVHRDVSPQNVLVGLDGIARVFDFGVAKAIGRLQTTQRGQIKGKLSYMAPEQLVGRPVDRRTDVYSASVMLWEALAGRRLFQADSQVALFGMLLHAPVPKPSTVVSSVSSQMDDVVLRGLDRNPDNRFQSAQEMAIALEEAEGIASPRVIGNWVESLASEALREKAAHVAELESVSTETHLSAINTGSFNALPDSTDLPTRIDARVTMSKSEEALTAVLQRAADQESVDAQIPVTIGPEVSGQSQRWWIVVALAVALLVALLVLAFRLST